MSKYVPPAMRSAGGEDRGGSRGGQDWGPSRGGGFAPPARGAGDSYSGGNGSWRDAGRGGGNGLAARPPPARGAPEAGRGPAVRAPPVKTAESSGWGGSNGGGRWDDRGGDRNGGGGWGDSSRGANGGGGGGSWGGDRGDRNGGSSYGGGYGGSGGSGWAPSVNGGRTGSNGWGGRDSRPDDRGSSYGGRQDAGASRSNGWDTNGYRDERGGGGGGGGWGGDGGRHSDSRPGGRGDGKSNGRDDRDELSKGKGKGKAKSPKEDAEPTKGAHRKAAKATDEPKGKGKASENGKGGGKRGKAESRAADDDDDAPAEKQKPSRKVGAKANGVSTDQVQSRTSSTTIGAMTDELFEDLEDVSPLTRRAIAEVFEYLTMTKVQAQTIEPCLSGADVVAKAKTGTGKTLGFLIPSVEMGLVRNPPPKGQVGVLCISPTRELAQQTAEEAKALLTFHDAKYGVQCVVGGTNMKTEQNALKRNPPPTVLVATPGRLNDHLENSGLRDLCQNLRVLVFDEADQLLDMGFRPAIEQMLKALPSKESRQNLLFSATFPAQVDTISKIAMRCQGKGKYQMIDTIGDEEVPTHKIPQTHLITSIEEQLPTVMCVLAQQAKKPDHKVIVFLPTARQTQLFAEVFNALADLKVFKSKCLEIHSRKSQPQRTRASEEFRNASKAILFSSDVSARGMDYPDVTFVLQCGVPSDKAQYVHRLGRTARAGKSGSGLLVLADFEKYFLNMIKDLPIKPDNAVDRAELDKMWYSVEDALANAHRANPQLGGMAYQAWMGFYNSYLGKLHWTKNELVEQANYYATECLKLAQIPALEPKTVGKMGLKGTPGLVIERRPPK